MQSAAKHLACVSNPVDTTVSITTPREMLRCALHDRHLSLFRNKPNKYSASTTYYYDWNISKRNGSTGATTTYSDSGSTVYLTTPGVGDWLDVLLRVNLSCGNFLPASSSCTGSKTGSTASSRGPCPARPRRPSPPTPTPPMSGCCCRPLPAPTRATTATVGAVAKLNPRRCGRMRYAEPAGGPLLPRPSGSESPNPISYLNGTAVPLSFTMLLPLRSRTMVAFSVILASPLTSLEVMVTASLTCPSWRWL